MKNFTVAMPLDEVLQKNIIQSIEKLDWLKDDCEVDFVHIYECENYPYLGIMYPDDVQKKNISIQLKKSFIEMTNHLDFKDKQVHIDFHENPKEGMVRFLKQNNVDAIITLTREKHGVLDFFQSSFTDYLISHAPCNVVVLRHKE